MITLLYRTLSALLFLHNSSWSASLKRRLLATYVGMTLFKFRFRSSKKVTLLGYTVRFGVYEDFLYLFSEVFVRQTYSFACQSDTPYILDCGSNIGMSILFFDLMYPRATIVAFEPSRHAFTCLTENINANHLDRVLAHNIALAGEAGTIDFYYDPANPTSLRMSSEKARMATASYRVCAGRLSDYVDRDVDFLKLDVEGAELEVVSELAAANKLSLIKQMVIEYHHHVIADTDALSRLLSVLEAAGFGYQIESTRSLRRPLRRKQSQDVLVYAYRKDSGG